MKRILIKSELFFIGIAILTSCASESSNVDESRQGQAAGTYAENVSSEHQESSLKKVMIRKGMSKAELISMTGNPQSVAHDIGFRGIGGHLTFFYQGEMCSSFMGCYVIVENDKVTRYEDFKPEYTDDLATTPQPEKKFAYNGDIYEGSGQCRRADAMTIDEFNVAAHNLSGQYFKNSECGEGYAFYDRNHLTTAILSLSEPTCQCMVQKRMNLSESAGKSRNGQILKDFIRYVDGFYEQAKIRNVSVNKKNSDALSIGYSFNLTDYNTLGECNVPATKIGISESYWLSASDAEKEVLVFHELGHCLLGRRHEDGLMPISGGTIFKSLMNSAGNALIYRFPNCEKNTNDCGRNGLVFAPIGNGNFYSEFHKIYMDELFGVVAPNAEANK